MSRLSTKLCACGCGERLSKLKYTYKHGHEPAGVGSRVIRVPPKLCLCGCGNKVTRREYDYRAGHRISVEQRLERRTVRIGDCWVWTGSSIPRGYGTVYFLPAQKKVYVHRLHDRCKGILNGATSWHWWCVCICHPHPPEKSGRAVATWVAAREKETSNA